PSTAASGARWEKRLAPTARAGLAATEGARNAATGARFSVLAVALGDGDRRRTSPGGGETHRGHIVAISGILLKLPPKLSLEKRHEDWSFGAASYISSE
ncbi:hypothetical protein, partial [Mesorhizobium sp.]|uniref:hypothetical protein n=1 Tax=Mesorhizobium sp. TaxID=1871066 RepID=UPI0025DC4019